MTERDVHGEHEDERNRASRDKRANDDARLAEERWQRRMWAGMPVGAIVPSGDFWGSKL